MKTRWYLYLPNILVNYRSLVMLQSTLGTEFYLNPLGLVALGITSPSIYVVHIAKTIFLSSPVSK